MILTTQLNSLLSKQNSTMITFARITPKLLHYTWPRQESECNETGERNRNRWRRGRGNRGQPRYAYPPALAGRMTATSTGSWTSSWWPWLRAQSCFAAWGRELGPDVRATTRCDCRLTCQCTVSTVKRTSH